MREPIFFGRPGKGASIRSLAEQMTDAVAKKLAEDGQPQRDDMASMLERQADEASEAIAQPQWEEIGRLVRAAKALANEGKLDDATLSDFEQKLRAVVPAGREDIISSRMRELRAVRGKVAAE